MSIINAWQKALMAGYVYTPTLPPIIHHIRSTIGNNYPVEPNCCNLCGESVRTSTREYVCINSVIQGDYEGTPIDSSAIRAWFCWDCFQASADSILIDYFKKYLFLSGFDNNKCLYCNKTVITGHEELQKHFLITFRFMTGGQNSCVIHENCYVKNINV